MTGIWSLLQVCSGVTEMLVRLISCDFQVESKFDDLPKYDAEATTTASTTTSSTNISATTTTNITTTSTTSIIMRGKLPRTPSAVVCTLTCNCCSASPRYQIHNVFCSRFMENICSKLLQIWKVDELRKQKRYF